MKLQLAKKFYVETLLYSKRCLISVSISQCGRVILTTYEKFIFQSSAVTKDLEASF